MIAREKTLKLCALVTLAVAGCGAKNPYKTKEPGCKTGCDSDTQERPVYQLNPVEDLDAHKWFERSKPWMKIESDEEREKFVKSWLLSNPLDFFGGRFAFFPQSLTPYDPGAPKRSELCTLRSLNAPSTTTENTFEVSASYGHCYGLRSSVVNNGTIYVDDTDIRRYFYLNTETIAPSAASNEYLNVKNGNQISKVFPFAPVSTTLVSSSEVEVKTLAMLVDAWKLKLSNPKDPTISQETDSFLFFSLGLSNAQKFSIKYNASQNTTKLSGHATFFVAGPLDNEHYLPPPFQFGAVAEKSTRYSAVYVFKDFEIKTAVPYSGNSPFQHDENSTFTGSYIFTLGGFAEFEIVGLGPVTLPNPKNRTNCDVEVYQLVGSARNWLGFMNLCAKSSDTKLSPNP